MHLDRLPVTSMLALCGSLALVASGAADMVANGGFESGPTVPPTGMMAVAPGSPALTGWTVTGGAITIVTDDYWQTYSGHRSVALSSSGPGAIQQTFDSSPGTTYRLSFYMSGEPFSTPSIKHLRVQAGGTTQDFTFDVTPAWHWAMGWQLHTLDFSAAGSSTMISFTSLDASANGPAIDSTRVEFVSAGVTPIAAELALAPVTPDPVIGAGRVAFALPSAQRVRLSVVDLQGREVALLAHGALGAGPHETALSPGSIGLRSGLYFLVLNAGDRTVVRRFTRLQ